VVFGAISGLIVNWLRKYRPIFWLGWLLSTVFTGLFYLVDRNTSTAESYIFQVFSGIGLGTILTLSSISVQASVAHVDDTGIAIGMLVIFRFFGSLLGVTTASTIFNSVFQMKINAVETLPQSLEVLRDAAAAVSFIPTLRSLDLPAETLDIILAVYTKPFQGIWLAMTGFAAVAFLSSLFLKEHSLEKDDVGRQGLQQRS